MKAYRLRTFAVVLSTTAVAASAVAATDTVNAALPAISAWQVVVNNGCRRRPRRHPCDFNSYNQPSVNVEQLVVFRAAARAARGASARTAFTRATWPSGGPVNVIFDRNTQVPQPNNLDTTFIEPPSFPRIDMSSNTIATRGNHQPVWEYFLEDGTETRAGTTGVYTNPFGPLITGASKLGAVPGFGFFAVPDSVPGTMFDVFPGAPAVTDGATIVFKGNYTVRRNSGGPRCNGRQDRRVLP